MLKIKLLFIPCCRFEYKIILQVAEKNEINKIIISKIKLIVLKLIINKISPSKFKVKGPPKFAIHRKNQKKDIIGNKFNFALLSIILRE